VRIQLHVRCDEDSRPYVLAVGREGSESAVSCTCPESRHTRFCRHVAALLTEDPECVVVPEEKSLFATAARWARNDPTIAPALKGWKLPQPVGEADRQPLSHAIRRALHAYLAQYRAGEETEKPGVDQEPNEPSAADG